MQVVILAAGRGKRFKQHSEDTPKCLIRVNGTPLLRNALDIVTRFGISRVVIVIGHLGSVVRQAVGPVFNGVPVQYIENPIYARTDNIYSLWLARQYLRQDTVLLECDIIFEAEGVADLFRQGPANIALVGKWLPFMDGTVVSLSDDLNITAMILGRDQGPGFDYTDKYKTVNITSFTREYLDDYFVPELEAHIEKRDVRRFYEWIIKRSIEAGKHPFQARIIDHTKWMEIDNPEDLQRAERLFAP